MKRTSIEARRWLFPGALAAVLVAGALWYGLAGTAQTNAEISASMPPSSAAPAKSPTPASEHSAKAVPEEPSSGQEQSRTPDSLGPTPFAASLSGTQIDGALTADDNGELVLLW